MADKKQGTQENPAKDTPPKEPAVETPPAGAVGDEPGGKKEPASGVDLQSVVDDIDDESPQANPEAIAASVFGDPPPESAAPLSPNAQVDSQGTRFDPAIHATKADGSPSITSAGKFRRKKGMGTRSTVAGTQPPQPKPGELTEQQKAHARATGVMCAEVLFRSCRMLGGAEWEPIKNPEKGIDERAEMHEAFGMYCEAKGVTDMPPGMLLAVTIGSYATTRFVNGEETKKRAGKARLWLEEKVAGWRRKRATRSDSRDDGKRKDASSEADSKPAQEAGSRGAGAGPNARQMGR